MKHLITIILILTFGCCQTTNDKNIDYKLKQFNDFLGKEKANALDKAVKSFEDFLINNYSDQKTRNERIRSFLEQLSINPAPDSSWVFNTERNMAILDMLESSGMRREIMLFDKENYEPEYLFGEFNMGENEDSLDLYRVISFEFEESEFIPIVGLDSVERAEIEMRNKEIEKELQNLCDSTLWQNPFGQFLYGLKKYAYEDTLVNNYIQFRETLYFLSYVYIVDAFLNPKIENYNPFLTRIIVADIYLDFMKWDIERNK
jgi:hypothetical protein